MGIKAGLILTLVTLLACSQQETVPQDPPQRVRIVERQAGADTLDSEPGIDAVENPDTIYNYIQVMWYSGARVSRYNIYRSQHETGQVNYQKIGTIEEDQNGDIDTIYIDTQDLELNVRYYYYVTAENEDNLESENSDTVSYRLLEKATHLGVNGNSSEINQPPIKFEWWLESGLTPDFYIIRLEQFINVDFHPVVYVRYIQSTYQSPQTFILDGGDIRSRLPDGKYRWRIDCVGEEDPDQNYYSGSESDWAVFRINWE